MLILELESENSNSEHNCRKGDESQKKAPTIGSALFVKEVGVADGTRTHDDQNHNLGLYQLSYSHRSLQL